MLYIDNPVGTGFSFTESDAGYAKNQTAVASDLFEALTQFFALFQEFRHNDFYVTGESYAGKYVPAIGYKLHQERNSVPRINFKGVAIGDGLCDPETMFHYSEYLYQIGLLDEKEAAYFRGQEDQAVAHIKQGQFLDAFHIFDDLMNGDMIPYPTYFKNKTGMTYYMNYLVSEEPEDMSYFGPYLDLPSTRKAIHVGNLTFNDGKQVESHLLEDVMKSVKPWVAVLMDNYKVLIYSGQLDIIVAAPLTQSFLQSVDWKYGDVYKTVDKSVWRLDPKDVEVAGYVRKVHDFVQVVVRNAGHILPYDQPRVAFEMISNFINNKF
jgi:vitellogenic carboxypeptidase-like protein